MKRLVVFLTAVICLAGSCNVVKEENEKFEKLAGDFFDGFLALNPEWATSLGDHRFDNLLSDYSPEGIDKRKVLLAAYRDSLDSIDPERLSVVNKIDYEILSNEINYRIFNLDTLLTYKWNPRLYNPGGAVYSLVARDFAPISERMKNVMERLRRIPVRLEQARANLVNPPEIYTETAIRQNRGTINLIRDDIQVYLDQAPEIKEEFEPVRERAIKALEDYGKWLEDDLLPNSKGDFRLGDAKYRAKLRYTLDSDLSKEEILKSAEEDLAKTQEDIYQTALQLYRRYFPDETKDIADKGKVVKAVLDRLAEDHPDAENVVEVAELSLKMCRDFVKEKDFVTVPNEPVNIIVMPEFQRGFAVAYCDSPGPLEKGAKTFFAISPPPSDWDSAQVASYFREYNDYMMWDLTIHEAMPGHYLQLAHANEFKAPTMVRSIFGSGPFVEGWATYAEQLMAEYGFGGPELKMQQLKMRLRMIINAIIDQKIHTEGMTEQEAMDMMINQGFQEEGEAAGKWRRACLSSTQLSTYYVGNLEINSIRKAYAEKYGDDYDIKNFHDTLLSFGSPPAKYVRQMMGL